MDAELMPSGATRGCGLGVTLSHNVSRSGYKSPGFLTLHTQPYEEFLISRRLLNAHY